MGEQIKNSEKKDNKDAKDSHDPKDNKETKDMKEPKEIKENKLWQPAGVKLQEVKDLLARSEISLLLDTYDDIFSDFDPRPYSQRALSDDFLSESRKVARDKMGTLELKFLVPQNTRKPEIESVIKKRLREHFKRHAALIAQENKKIVRNGIIITFVGFIFMLLATSIDHFSLQNFIFSFIKIVLEPAGWFVVWFGLDEIFYKARQQSSEQEFYQKMVKANITFSAY